VGADIHRPAEAEIRHLAAEEAGSSLGEVAVV